MILIVPYRSDPASKAVPDDSCFFCWPQAFKEPSPSPSSNRSISGAKTGAKLQLFPIQASVFATFFQKNVIFFLFTDYQRDTKQRKHSLNP